MVDSCSSVNLPDVSVLKVPRGSIVVLRGELGSTDFEGALVHEIHRTFGHKEFLVVWLPEGTDLAVIHDPEAMKVLMGLVDESPEPAPSPGSG